MATEREKMIRRRRHRRERVGKLKQQFKKAKSDQEKKRILELILRRDPLLLHRLKVKNASALSEKQLEK